MVVLSPPVRVFLSGLLCESLMDTDYHPKQGLNQRVKEIFRTKGKRLREAGN